MIATQTSECALDSESASEYWFEDIGGQITRSLYNLIN